MIFTRTLPQNGIFARVRSRAIAVVRCTAAVEPDLYAPQRPGGERGPQPAGGASPSRASLRAASPRRGFVKGSPVAPADGSAPRPDWERRDVSASRRQHAHHLLPGQQLTQPSQQPAQRGDRRPVVVFLEDDAESAARKAKVMYTKYLSQGRGHAVVARSLGRQGAAGAMKFILALRAVAEASSVACDVRFRLYPQEPVLAFGTPLMMFVEAQPGRLALPADNSPQCISLTVSARTDIVRLQTKIYGVLEGLREGEFLRLDTVGNDTLHLALRALALAREQMGRVGGSVFALPHVVTEPRRVSAVQQQQQHQTESDSIGGVDASQDLAATATDRYPFEQGPEAAEAEPLLLQVLRIYVGRTLPSRSEPASSSGSPAAAEPLLAVEAVAEAGSPAAGAAAVAGEGQIIVSVAEWEALKGALGSMMEQQKLLAELFEKEKRNANGNAGGNANPSGP